MSNIVAEALEYIDAHYGTKRVFNNTKAVGDYFCLRLGLEEREVFSVAFLDSQLRLIEVEDLFFGSINTAFVSPREIVKAALRHNCSAVVLAHNHPSGGLTPSQSDHNLTGDIKAACKLIDVRVVDHIIVGGAHHYSFADSDEL